MPSQPACFHRLEEIFNALRGHRHPPSSTARGGTGQRAVCPDPGGAEDLTDKLFEL